MPPPYREPKDAAADWIAGEPKGAAADWTEERRRKEADQEPPGGEQD
jgi:hypothetical protein